MKQKIVLSVCTALVVTCGALGVATAADSSKDGGFANEMAKRSYALGMNIGESVKGLPVDVDAKALAQGLRDVLGDATPKLSEQEASITYQALMRDVQTAQVERLKQQAQSNLEAGQAFLTKNKTKDGVKVTDSGLQYKVLEKGDGPQPDANDTVTVHYVGTLIDGTVFDSSRERGEPATFPVDGVIAGWTEALQLMHEGARYKLFIPPKLAYGIRGAGPKIGPNETLIFDVELLKVNKKDAAK